MTDAEIKSIESYLLDREKTDYKLSKKIMGILEDYKRQQAEIENQSQNFKMLVSDHRCLQQSFNNLHNLYVGEKIKVKKAKEKLINMAKSLQTAKTEIERLKYNLEAVLNERADHSEAIKEFKSKVENDIVVLLGKSNCTEFIDCLEYRYKEMVGDAE